MKKSIKKVLNVAFIVAIGVGASVATTLYLNEEKSAKDVFEDTFNQPIHYAAIGGASGEAVDFTAAAESTVHAVVHIKSTQNVSSQSSGQGQYMDPFEFFFGNGGRSFQRPQARPRVGAGSGVIISTDGYIITNNHVIDGADELEVTLNDNRTFSAKVIGADPMTDIALIKVSAEDLPTIPFGDSEKLKVGEWVLAVGNPFNLTSTVTAGIVSAKGRGISMGGASKIESFIQTDAAVNPGNSGGALVNTKGELVGINTAIYSETGNFAGYSFAVPISMAGKIVGDLKQFGAVQRAVLGVQILDVSVLKDLKDISDDDKEKVKVLEGAYVAGFAQRSVAKEVGIEEGDVITAVNGVSLKSANALQEQISKYRPGDEVSIKVNREGENKTFKVELRNMQGSTEVVKKTDGTELLGAAFKALSKEQQKELGVNYGIEVTGLTDGKLEEAGIKKGFVIMIVNEQKISSVEQFEKMTDKLIKGMGEDDKVLFIKGFYPNGRTRYYAIDLTE